MEPHLLEFFCNRKRHTGSLFPVSQGSIHDLNGSFFHCLKSKMISLKWRVFRKVLDVLFDIQKVVNVIETIGHIILFVRIDVKSF